MRNFLDETHKTPKAHKTLTFHGGNVSATQFLDSFRIYLSIRGITEGCTNIILRVKTIMKVKAQTEKMGSARELHLLTA